MRKKNNTKELLLSEIQELRRRHAREREDFAHTLILFQTILDESNLVVYIKKAEDLSHVWVSKAFEKAVGISRENAIDKTNRELFGEKIGATFDSTDRKVLAGEGMEIEESPDGKNIYWSQKFPVKLPNDRVYLCGIAKNITRRRLAEKALHEFRDELEERVEERTSELQESEEQVRLLLDSTAEAIYGIDLGGNCTFVNPACVRMLGYQNSSELIRKNMHELMHHTRRDGTPYPTAECKIYKAFREGEGTHVDDEVLWRADGSSFPAEYWSYPIRRNGNVIGSVVTFLDTTERAALEEQLRMSQKMEAVGTLAGGLAHDFNNLLTVITGYSDSCLTSLRPEDPLHHDLNEIKEAGDRAAALIGQLLVFSRKQIFQVKAIDLGETVAGIEDLLRRLIGEHIKLDIQRDPNLHMIKADPGQIERVIINLLVNARDSLPKGGNITMRIENAVLDEQAVAALGDFPAGNYIMLSVSDTGVGMEKDVLSNIFEPFYTTKGADEGTGLGLATVFGIVNQSGGRIDVESEPGKGSTFRIYLPQTEASEPAAEESEHLATSAEGDETIMVVDDEEMIRTLLEQTLKGFGYTVLTARDGEEALLTAEQHEGPIDLMVTDVVMPQMSGYELAERLAPLRPEISVLFMSGYDTKMAADQDNLDQENHFLPKPFLPRDLANNIRQILDKTVAAH